MYNIQKNVEGLLKVVHKNKKKVSNVQALKDIDDLQAALEKFSGYKVNFSGTLVATGKR